MDLAEATAGDVEAVLADQTTVVVSDAAKSGYEGGNGARERRGDSVSG